MDCPVCKSAMIILEFKEVELDYCLSCHGIWLDQGELEVLLDMKEQIDFSHMTDLEKSRRKCPRCHKKMVKTRYPNSEVEVDLCPRDSGVWLDKGEIEAIARSSTSQSSFQKIAEFFKDFYLDKSTDEEA